MFIHNPSACVEINRLKDYGIWQTSGAAFGINESWDLQLESIIPTIYSEKVYEALMLDRLSEDDIKRTIESLKLSKEGTPERMLTEEDYKEVKNRTEWQRLDQEGNIKALKEGTTTVKVSTSNGKESKTVVNVKKSGVKATSIKLDKTSAKLEEHHATAREGLRHT